MQIAGKITQFETAARKLLVMLKQTAGSGSERMQMLTKLRFELNDAFCELRAVAENEQHSFESAQTYSRFFSELEGGHEYFQRAMSSLCNCSDPHEDMANPYRLIAAERAVDDWLVRIKLLLRPDLAHRLLARSQTSAVTL